MDSFGGWRWDPAMLWLKPLTTVATPMFVFMFGMMLDVAYQRMAREDGMRVVVRRFLKRSCQCYGGYLLTALAGFAGGYLTLREFGLAAVFLADSHHGNILRLYTFALLLSPFVVWVRLRWGVWPLFVMLAGLWLVDGLILKPFDGEDLGWATHWAGVVFGTGSYQGGPSVWHGLTFVLAGVIAAAGLRGWRERGFRAFYVYVGLMLLIALAVTANLYRFYGFWGLFKGYTVYFEFRADNHPGYYVIGLAGCLLVISLLSRVVPRDRLPGWKVYPLRFGQMALTSFTLGNVLLNLVPASLIGGGLGVWAIPVGILYVGLILVLVNLMHSLFFRRRKPVSGPPNKRAP